ncbi:MAG: hypothetical protein Q7J78_01085, partial [Clostridiales bacterium]|nr:hypothetical protein [Clostridiales bacterium]
MTIRPLTTSTSGGVTSSVTSVSGNSIEASLDSKGLRQYFFTLSNSPSVTFPSRTMSLATLHPGLSLKVRIWIHCAAES